MFLFDSIYIGVHTYKFLLHIPTQFSTRKHCLLIKVYLHAREHKLLIPPPVPRVVLIYRGTTEEKIIYYNIYGKKVMNIFSTIIMCTSQIP